jgi:hypothetical protein
MVVHPNIARSELKWRLSNGGEQMRFLRRHWYDLGAVVAIGVGAVSFFLWHDMSLIQRVLLLNFIMMLAHQYEEYGWPGGFPPLVNLVFWPRNKPDRYPLNQNGAMVINLICHMCFIWLLSFSRL